jgi:protein-tyrosine phosphatase
VIDLHSHLLPAIDDGSQSEGQSVRTLSLLVQDGVTDVVMTPHLLASDIDRRGEEIIERRNLLLESLRRVAPQGTTLHAGFEIMLDALLSAYAVGDRRFALNGSRYYLVEFPPSLGPAPASAALSALVQQGAVPLVAHPERYHLCTVRDFGHWRALGAYLQVDATTLTRPTGRGDMARKLVQGGLADVLAADNHGDRRSLATGLHYLVGRGAQDQAHLLTRENPKAVLEDREMARVPAVALKLGIGERVSGWLREVR